MINMNLEEMPKVRPLPIPTSGLSIVKKVGVWFTNARRWEVLEDWYYTLPSGTRIVIPKGFIFDGASIPRLFWVILNPVGILFIPGLVHDYAYRFDKLIEVTDDGGRYDYMDGAGKKYWDKLFEDCAVTINGFKTVNAIAHGALLIGGGFAWRNRRMGLPETR